MQYPKKIKIISDDNELELSEVLSVKKLIIVNYIYTKSETKFGMILPLSEEDLEKILKKNIAIEIV